MSFNTNYNIKAEIGVALSGSTWTYAILSAGIDNIAESLNEVIQQYQFLNGQGFAENHVTGAAPAWTLSGRRILGDTAQDYIAGLKYQFDEARKSSFKLSYTKGAINYSLTVPCTICNIVDLGGGAATDDSVFSCEIRFDGAPVIPATGLRVTASALAAGSSSISVFGGNVTALGTIYYKKNAVGSLPNVGTAYSSLAGWTEGTLNAQSAILVSSLTDGDTIDVISLDVYNNVRYGGSVEVES